MVGWLDGWMVGWLVGWMVIINEPQHSGISLIVNRDQGSSSGFRTATYLIGSNFSESLKFMSSPTYSAFGIWQGCDDFIIAFSDPASNKTIFIKYIVVPLSKLDLFLMVLFRFIGKLMLTMREHDFCKINLPCNCVRPPRKTREKRLLTYGSSLQGSGPYDELHGSLVHTFHDDLINKVLIHFAVEMSFSILLENKDLSKNDVDVLKTKHDKGSSRIFAT
ncbi:unnamed protein product [Thelazia callipaeda]|uniref:Reverse transcriptase Ty1/copia-type domain-containing protein n=1 Tax=Thelazia callipaeda TaxID=103827 RepID=A0A0N5CZ36_THECL|nr:unnamed protein product [Thelazia callipaeda]